MARTKNQKQGDDEGVKPICRNKRAFHEYNLFDTLECGIVLTGTENRMNHKPKRPRKLLLHRREIGKFAGKASERGFTLVPLRMYFKHGRAKVELAVARGKQQHDKREDQKKAEAQREIRRAMTQRNRG
jgi:SsrA-binding protein